jgi:hypothetical protein
MSPGDPDDPDGARDPTPSQPAGQPRRPRGGGSVTLGIVAGIVGLFGLYFALAMLAGPGWITALLPIVVYVIGSVLLAVRPRTARFGAGLLIGLGVWLLVGGGVCIAILVPPGGLV